MAYTAFSGDATQGANTGDLSGGQHVDSFIPQLWSQGIFRYFNKNLVLRPFFDDYSSMVQGKGDILNIPTIQEVATARKAENTGVAYSVNTETAVQLLIDQHFYSAKLIEDIAMVQANEQMFDKYAASMAYGLAKAVDEEIHTALKALGTTQSLAVDNSMSNADIETAIGTMLSNDVPLDECALFVNPLIYADLLNSKSFISASVSGSTSTSAGLGLNDNSDAMQTGLVGSIYGVPVMTSSIFAVAAGTGTHVGFLAHRSAVAVAVQQSMRLNASYSVDYLATRVVSDIIFGAKETTANHVKGIEFLNP